MHLGKTGRPASFVDGAHGICPCSGESRVCVIGRGLQTTKRNMDSLMGKDSS